jgi:hypothetical protein
MATGIQNSIIIEIDVTADATGTNGPTYIVPRTGEIINAWAVATATSGGGTMTIQRQALGAGSFNAASGAITCAVSNALSFAGSLITAQTSCASTDVLRIVANGAADRGRVYIQFLAPVVP